LLAPTTPWHGSSVHLSMCAQLCEHDDLASPNFAHASISCLSWMSLYMGHLNLLFQGQFTKFLSIHHTFVNVTTSKCNELAPQIWYLCWRWRLSLYIGHLDLLLNVTGVIFQNSSPSVTLLWMQPLKNRMNPSIMLSPGGSSWTPAVVYYQLWFTCIHDFITILKYYI
jgi:hypothetical protein